GIVAVGTIAVQLAEIREQTADVIERVRALRMARYLRNLPGRQLRIDVLRKLLAFFLQPADLVRNVDGRVLMNVPKLVDLCLQLGDRLLEFEKGLLHSDVMAVRLARSEQKRRRQPASPIITDLESGPPLRYRPVCGAMPRTLRWRSPRRARWRRPSAQRAPVPRPAAPRPRAGPGWAPAARANQARSRTGIATRRSRGGNPCRAGRTPSARGWKDRDRWQQRVAIAPARRRARTVLRSSPAAACPRARDIYAAR